MTTLIELLKIKLTGTPTLQGFIDNLNTLDANTVQNMYNNFELVNSVELLNGTKNNCDNTFINCNANASSYGFDSYGENPNDNEFTWNVDFYLFGLDGKWNSYWDATKVLTIVETLLESVNNNREMPNELSLTGSYDYEGSITFKNLKNNPVMELDVLNFLTHDKESIADFLTIMVKDTLKAYTKMRLYELNQ